MSDLSWLRSGLTTLRVHPRATVTGFAAAATPAGAPHAPGEEPAVCATPGAYCQSTSAATTSSHSVLSQPHSTGPSIVLTALLSTRTRGTLGARGGLAGQSVRQPAAPVSGAPLAAPGRDTRATDHRRRPPASQCHGPYVNKCRAPPIRRRHVKDTARALCDRPRRSRGRRRRPPRVFSRRSVWVTRPESEGRRRRSGRWMLQLGLGEPASAPLGRRSVAAGAAAPVWRPPDRATADHSLRRRDDFIARRVAGSIINSGAA